MNQSTRLAAVNKSSAAVLICKNSFFSVGSPAAFEAKKRTRRGYGFLLVVAVLAVCSAVISTLYTSVPVQAHVPPVLSAPIAAVPLRVEETSYLSIIQFETITYEDASMYVGETAIVAEGRNGLRRVTESLDYNADGSVSAIAVTSELIVETIAETIAVGSTDRPATASYGAYIWPAGGDLYSTFGPRSGGVGSSNHKGIDISGKKGDSIYAADGGEVILADSSLSGFGLLVQILHDNGEVTYYAHNSELLVECGQRVSQGQEIAKMGSTGTASGVHVHFEIRVDDTPVDPIDYLP